MGLTSMYGMFSKISCLCAKLLKKFEITSNIENFFNKTILSKSNENMNMILNTSVNDI